MPAVAAQNPITTTSFCVDIGLAKALADQDDWIIYIQASSPIEDYEGDTLPPVLLRKAPPYFLDNGRITYEHVTKENRHDPSIFIGEPLDVRFSASEQMQAKAMLYRHMEKAQQVRNILRSGGKMKASLGGGMVRKLDSAGHAYIASIFVNHIALTPWPVNDDTDVSLTPYDAFLKALSTPDAAALVPEDLEGSAKATETNLSPEFRQRWSLLTEIVTQLLCAQGQNPSPEHARRMALAILVRKGEASHVGNLGV